MGPVCGVAAAVLAREDDIDKLTSTNSSTHGPFYLVVLQLIIASKLVRAI